MSGATALGEGDVKYKVDVNLVFGNQKKHKQFVLRTTLDRLNVWKAKYPDISTSPFESIRHGTIKDAALIDGEIWVFGIDATNAQDIVTAVEICTTYYKINASEIFSDVYIKNLNAEREESMNLQALIRANKSLYQKTCEAVREAARKLNMKGALNLWVISSKINQKIPQEELHDALKKGGAESVEMDSTPIRYVSGSNDGKRRQLFKTNLHLAGISV